ncbi:unnamed protein product [Phyllotreta striolata]|uniref:Uncharacterized protein n=1 Tax=Phyllotreta striolata TaxID=444603 RepID=A0A9N9TMX8_PHYSR|nr:unnamed protein product [Phyllotreta striolata]
MMMISFRIAGDSWLAFALLFLPVSIILRNSYAGVSQRTQLLLSMVFITRYVDLYLNFQYLSNYYIVTGILFIITTSVTFLMGYWWNDIDKKDTYKSELLIFGAMVAAIFNAPTSQSTEILKAFSEYLESVAIAPQVFLILSTKQITKAMVVYMLSMVVYITFYFIHWMHRYNTEGYFDAIADVSAMIFIGIYGVASLLMACRGVTLSSDGKSTSSLKSRVTLFSISGQLCYNGGGKDIVPLVKDKELVRGDKTILEGF